jgi:hypothetical protein
LNDIDRILLGTEWIKVAAKHHGQKGKIDNLGPRGPRMRLLATPIHARHGGSHSGQPMYQRLDWWELGNNWEPYSNRDKRQYELWQTATEVERLQKERDKQIMAENIEPISTPVEVVCTSVYHKPLKGSVLIENAYKTRQDNWVCLGCKAQRNIYQANHAADMRAKKKAIALAAPKKLVVIPEPIEIEPLKIESEIEVLPEWRITIVEPTVHVVRARDFLEAATLVSQKGEIVKIERL